ncbi:MAG TPA: SDR family NAD(P)-dependent oxidoreductase [Candidatus Binataceae bacterium]|nr:SDR family NAD(P)-dependent oxidoreductase [Candidatus Binataceae bacterium]
MIIAGKRILVTGGAGFIGSELVRQLAELRAEVAVVDNLVNGRRENLAGLPGDVLFVEADIRDTERMEKLAKRADLIFHLACLGVRHSIHSPRENHEVNAAGTLSMLMAARTAGAERFVYVSSSEVYGPARWVPMSEDHPTFPRTVYGASKLAGECYTRAFYYTHGFPTVVIRPFNTYGPRCHHEGDSGEVIPKFLLRCMAGRPMVIFGDGKQTRDFTYVTDSARGIIIAGTNDRAIGATLNLGSGQEVSIADLAREVGAAIGRPAPPVEHIEPRPGDVGRLCADMSRARELCGYQATVTLQEGLGQLKNWYEAQGTPPEVLLEKEIVQNWVGKHA